MPKDKSSLEPKKLPDHHSGVRRAIADSRETQYVAFKSLAEAKSATDGVIVFEGDFGGQIYLVARASCVLCSEQVLQQLLLDLDARGWSEPKGARVYYESHRVGEAVAGGM